MVLPLQIQFMGQTCLLIRYGSQTLWVNPQFSAYSRKGGKRKPSLEINWNEIARPDLILLSSAQEPDFDLSSYKYASWHTPIVTETKIKKKLPMFLNNPCIELKPNEAHHHGEIKITRLASENSKLKQALGWAPPHFLIQLGEYHLLFVGDGPYDQEFFSTLGHEYNFDAVFLPIHPYKLYKKKHLGPEGALQAALDLKAKRMIPIQWGAFRLGWTKSEQSLKNFQKILAQNEYQNIPIKILEPGESFQITHESHPLSSSVVTTPVQELNTVTEGAS